MSRKLRIAAIAGSLRNTSYSKMVLSTIADLLPEHSTFATIEVDAMPYYNEDLEHSDLPENVVAGRELVAASDALVIVTPEFNHGIPGVLKNTLDWLSRPAFESCAVGKPVLFVTISPGALGGVRAQYQLRETLAAMQCALIPLPEVAITNIGSKVGDGKLVDAATLKFVGTVLARFLTAIAVD